MTRNATLFASALLLFACKAEPPPEPPPREAIAVQYVASPELLVHSKPSDDSRVMTKFLSGESVSVLSKKSGWAEVRTTGGSGWAHDGELSDGAAAKQEQDNPTPRFRSAPSPVTQPGVHGTVYIEANVNSDGDVTRTSLITNTTGSDTLAEKNAAALQSAKFYPIVQKGQKKAFVYYYRIDY